MTDRELMHQALEALEWASDMIPQQKEPVCDCPICKASDALRERLAQPEQEPVAWTPQVWRQFRPDGTLEFQKIKRTPNGAWEDYTTPPRREWVGLTDEEFSHGLQMASNTSWMKAAKWVEAKLREKNSMGVLK